MSNQVALTASLATKQFISLSPGRGNVAKNKRANCSCYIMLYLTKSVKINKLFYIRTSKF